MRSVDRPSVTIDLSRIQANGEAIARRTGVPVIAVVKADAYGHGARRVVQALGDLVEAFYVFDAAETVHYDAIDTGKPTIALLGASDDPGDYLARRIRPAVWTAERASRLRDARPVLSLDTGQHRFGCGGEQADAVVRAGGCDEAFTHATTLAQVQQFRETVGGKVAKLHAAGSALLDEPGAWLDAVRPGLALYLGAARVTAPLLEARDDSGPAGYSGFVSSTGRLGIFAAGYSDGFRSGGTCLVNGVARRVREIGMQSAFIEHGSRDKAGDEVVLLGDSIAPRDVATAWGTSPQEALYRLVGAGKRSYLGE